MKTSTVLALAATIIGAQSQTSDESSVTPTRSATSTLSSASSSPPTTHTVAVGASGHSFTDAEITAEVGDTVEFIFYPANHSVIRAEYGYPCVPYEIHGVGREGFDSGFHPVRAITNDSPRWSLLINDTEPIFYYCGADGSCYRNHMIGVINPNSTQTLEDHLKAAEGLTFQVLPGEPYPEESGYGGPSAPTSTGSSGDDDVSSSGSDDDSRSGGGSATLSGGQIAGIAVGGAAVVFLGAALLFWCARRGAFHQANKRNTFTSMAPTVSEADYTIGPKSPGMDSRWSAAQWSSNGPYPEQGSPGFVPMGGQPGQYGYGYPSMDPQHTGHSTHSGLTPDPRLSSPPPLNSPHVQSPVELPSENGQEGVQTQTGNEQRHS